MTGSDRNHAPSPAHGPEAPAAPATWRLATGAGAPAPIAIVELRGDVDRALEALGVRALASGAVALRDLCGIDTGLVARWNPAFVQLMPHGGIEVVRRLTEALERVGIPRAEPPDARARYPEARSLIEARTLEALARAASPLAVDLLLDQPARWARTGASSDPARDAILCRLIEPPLVVAIGAANVGKSSLVNALARTSVSVVTPEPGTTRDHVGAMIDLAGLVVRYIDTPGTRPGADAIEDEAHGLAGELVGSADLLLRCGDALAPPPDPPAGPADAPRPVVLTAALRTDLGEPAFEANARVSVTGGRGLDELARLIRDALVPPELLESDRPWRFWAGE